MSPKEIDQLFQEGLEKPLKFNHAEEQWATVASKLHPTRRRWLWLWSSLIGVMCVLFVWYQNDTTRASWSEKAPESSMVETVADIPSKSFPTPASGVMDAESQEMNVSPPLNILDQPKAKSSANTPDRKNAPRKPNEFTTSIEKPLAPNTYPSATSVDKSPYGTTTSLPPLTQTEQPVAPLARQKMTEITTQTEKEPLLPRVDQRPQASTIKKPRFSLSAGIIQHWQQHPQVSLSTPIAPYLELEYRFLTRWSISLLYTQGRRAFSLEDDPNKYGVGFDNIYAPGPPDSTGLSYQAQSLSICLWQVHNEITIRRQRAAGKGHVRKQMRMASGNPAAVGRIP